AVMASAAPVRGAGWTVVHAAHFTVYSNASEPAAQALAGGFERLHAFFAAQLGVKPAGDAVRVGCFATEAEFAQYRVRPDTSAFYLAAPGADYIVMPLGARGDLRIPAHEYAHLLVHSTGWSLPAWLAEGISEVASTVRIGERESRAGGDLPERSRWLKTSPWIPLAEVFTRRDDRQPMFYAQSWAVVDLLMFAPKYSKNFPAFLASVATGSSTEKALAGVYHTTVEAVETDLRSRALRANAPVSFAGVTDAPSAMK